MVQTRSDINKASPQLKKGSGLICMSGLCVSGRCQALVKLSVNLCIMDLVIQKLVLIYIYVMH